jgi:predicted RNA methylase
MQIFNESEWKDVLLKYPKPSDEIKEIIWEKTRNISLPLVEISENECFEDFEKLKKLDTKTLVKEGNLFSRYEYKWELGKKYIDSCNIGNKSSNYFHQELRYHCDSINSPSPYRNWTEKKFFFTLCNALWSLKVKEVSVDSLRSCIALRKYIASQFRPSAAKAIYEIFQSECVLDFSSGWGDRLSAAMATPSIKKYTGIDPNKDLIHNYKKQIETFNAPDKTIRLISLPAEEAIENSEEEYDTIFTSPPYFIVERYSKDDTQSWQRYKKIDIWLEKFLFKTLKGCWNLLKPNGILAINISDVYCNHTINHICDPMNDFISSLSNSKKEENINYRMAKRINSKSNKEGIFVEPIWIWKKT